jgi:TP901 family phage tail tape measure protein
MANDLKLRVLLNLVENATGPLRNIMGGSNQAATSLKATRDRLKELDKAQKDVAAFRQLRTGAASTATQLEAAQARVDGLARQIGAAGAPTRAMSREFAQARREATQLRNAHDQQQQQLQQLRTRLSGAGIDTRQLAQHERDLRANVRSTTAEMERQQRALSELAARQRRLADARARMEATQRTAGKMKSTGAGMAAAGAATGAGVAVTVSEYAKAEDSATQLSGALMRAGAVVPPEFQKINGLAMKLGDRLPGTTSDFQDMMTMLTRQGISAQSILGGMGEATAYLGVQLKKAPDEAAEFAAKLQDATKTTEKDMLSLMDVIQRTFYLGVDDNNMLNGMAKLGPAMDTIKMKGLEGAKALAPLLVMADQAGMQGEASGNAYRKVFQMGMDKKKIAKANKSLAPAQRLDFTDGKGEFGGLDNMFKQLDKLKGLTTQKRLSVLKEVFGDDAETLQVVSLLMEKGVDGYREVQGKMAAQASLQERVNQQLGTLKNLWEAAGGTFTNTMVAFGETIAPELKATTEWLGETAQNVGAWARENPRLAGGLMKAAAVLAIVLTVGGALLLMLGSILGPLAGLKFAMTTLGMQGGILANVFRLMVSPLRLVGSAILFIGRALLMNPIGLAITAIGLAAYAIYTYWEPIKGFFSGLWDQVKGAFSGGLGGIAALILNWSPMGLFYQAFAGVMSWFGVQMPAKFSEFGANLVAGLVNGITSGMGAVKDSISNMGGAAIGWFKEKLGIHSPSRVFGELGGFISQGAAIGMESEQGRVVRAAVGLATAAATAFTPAAATPLQAGQGAAIAAAAPGAGAAAAGPTTINIYAQPGMDAAAIARAVRTELDKRDRDRQARVSSRLGD